MIYLIVDVWSAGCVLAELLLGQPIFPGDSGVDQLVEIIKVLGTPTRDQIKEMNPNYTEFKFPQIKSHPWQKVSGVELQFEQKKPLLCQNTHKYWRNSCLCRLLYVTNHQKNKKLGSKFKYSKISQSIRLVFFFFVISLIFFSCYLNECHIQIALLNINVFE